MVRWLLTTFIALTILSGCWPWLRKLGVGRLPGDITVRVGSHAYCIPFMSTLLLSMLGSFLARLL